MRKSEPKASFIFGAIPHSVLRRTKQIKNPTASALLLLLAERTFAFRKGFVDLNYQKIAQELGVTWRTIVSAAKRLQEQGDIIREKIPGGAYRWWVPINCDEVLVDPDNRFCVRVKNENSVTPSPDRSITSPPDRSIRTPLIDRSGEQAPGKTESNPCAVSSEASRETSKTEPLKKVFKEIDLKKQQQEQPAETDAISAEEMKFEKAEPATQNQNQIDDEPLHKICLKSLQSYGVSQRVARQLCREYEHETIQRVLDTVPGMSGIQNLAGYLVAAIKDGGYEMTAHSAGGKKNAPQVTGRRSNYAHLTNDNVKSDRHRNVKDSGDAPILYRTVEETKQENERLEAERLEREESYREQSQSLAQRFQALSDNVKERLKGVSASYLVKSVPSTAKREDMLRDKTFQRVANRTVLERFFEWVDQGMSPELALGKLAKV